MARLSIMMALFHSHSSVLLSTSVQTITSGWPLVAAQPSMLPAAVRDVLGSDAGSIC